WARPCVSVILLGGDFVHIGSSLFASCVQVVCGSLPAHLFRCLVSHAHCDVWSSVTSGLQDAGGIVFCCSFYRFLLFFVLSSSCRRPSPRVSSSFLTISAVTCPPQL
ncbi:unnamed protein product, partial [Ectocarpus sp. 12 AP-2014]